jgi:hypothetical protein
MIGSKVIVRSNVAGVHAGVVESIDPATGTVVLVDACRLWRVYTRDKTGSVSDIARNGLKAPIEQHSVGAKLKRVMIVNPRGLEIAEFENDEAFESVQKAAPAHS